ncbi:MAG TPA: SulP family inorganic anion transporter [Noviherbaspirillum sp.]
MTIAAPENLTGNFWGGLAAMLVALPSAIAFGVTIYSPLGDAYAAVGALAGILGATALGLIAPAFGGAQRLITAPCAPAAAVLSAFALGLLQQDVPPVSALLLLALLGLTAGALQIAFGLIGLGRLIKYMPYPVVSGYLSGVGLYIIGSQVPRLLGMPQGAHFWESLAAWPMWQWQGIVVGIVTMLVMTGASRFTKAVPAAILALAAGVLAYFGLSLVDPSLLVLDNNPLVIGPIDGGGGSIVDLVAGRWQGIDTIGAAEFRLLIGSALTLAVLLSIDTLKTCVVLDALTRSRHDSNRELIAQGLGNMSASIVGGIPGAGTMGATLVNISSGGTSRLSGVIEGMLALTAFLLFGRMIAWVPISALAGILIVVGARMIDRESLHFLRSRSTILDFIVIVAVVIVALTASLIAASGVGIVLAVILFVREQTGGRVVYRKSYGNKTFSKQVRLQDEMRVLEKTGDQSVIFELQGSLFFGTADQLYCALEPELKRCNYVILDMRRVQSVDITAGHTLEQITAMLAERNAYLLLSHIPKNLPSGQDMQQYFDAIGLVREERPVRVFNELDDALEWVEDRILADAGVEPSETQALELAQFGIFRKRKEATIAALEACMERRSFRTGEKIFSIGDTGDELFLIRRGLVRIMLPLGPQQSHHLSTFGQGSFFGEMAFLDGAARSADAIAFADTDLFVLPRSVFDRIAEEHKKTAIKLLESLASALAARLRYANAEISALE